MSRPTDASLARAFWEVTHPAGYVREKVVELARQYDTEAAPHVNETAGTFTSRGANVKKASETERGYCPLCTGNVWKGRYCNGPKCPLRPA